MVRVPKCRKLLPFTMWITAVRRNNKDKQRAIDGKNEANRENNTAANAYLPSAPMEWTGWTLNIEHRLNRIVFSFSPSFFAAAKVYSIFGNDMDWNMNWATIERSRKQVNASRFEYFSWFLEHCTMSRELRVLTVNSITSTPYTLTIVAKVINWKTFQTINSVHSFFLRFVCSFSLMLLSMLSNSIDKRSTETLQSNSIELKVNYIFISLILYVILPLVARQKTEFAKKLRKIKIWNCY